MKKKNNPLIDSLFVQYKEICAFVDGVQIGKRLAAQQILNSLDK